MRDPDDVRADYESDGLRSLVERLVLERPVPRAGFRRELSRRLLEAGRPFNRPRRLRLLIAIYAGSGTALLAAGALGLAGIGPFAA